MLLWLLNRVKSQGGLLFTFFLVLFSQWDGQCAPEAKVTVAAIQFAMHSDWEPNLKKAVDLVRLAAEQGAQIVLLPELFLGEYFCKTEEARFFSKAMHVGQGAIFSELQALAQELKVVLPVSFFETDGVHYFNSVLMINADGKPLGVYRKSHIPDGPGYEEKFYFRPGNTGFKVWDTAYGKVGVGICWDQWFPEAARAMMLQGAQVLLFPSAIGSEPENPDLQTKDRWQLAMRGHAVHNVVPVVAANRIGNEAGQTFYGHSFICDAAGVVQQELGLSDEGVICHPLDFAQEMSDRAAWGFFRDRRPELYGLLTQL